MNAPYYNGEPDDPNEFDLQPEDESCPSCGADPDDPCLPFCNCEYCQRARATNSDEAA